MSRSRLTNDRNMIALLLQSPEGTSLWQIVKVVPYARCRSKMPVRVQGETPGQIQGATLVQ